MIGDVSLNVVFVIMCMVVLLCVNDGSVLVVWWMNVGVVFLCLIGSVI